MKTTYLQSSSVSVHQRHLLSLVTEIDNSTTQINPGMDKQQNFRKKTKLLLPNTPLEKRTHSLHALNITVLIPFIFGDSCFRTIFLGILNLTNQYLD